MRKRSWTPDSLDDREVEEADDPSWTVLNLQQRTAQAQDVPPCLVACRDPHDAIVQDYSTLQLIFFQSAFSR